VRAYASTIKEESNLDIPPASRRTVGTVVLVMRTTNLFPLDAAPEKEGVRN
jgi:hypothetical protein